MIFRVIDHDDNDSVAYRDTREGCERWLSQNQDLHSSDKGPRFTMDVESPPIVDRIRLIAYLIESTPGLDPQAMEIRCDGTVKLVAYLSDEAEQQKMAAAFCRAMGKTKKEYTTSFAYLIGTYYGIRVELVMDRQAVCRRIQKQVTLPAEPEQVIPAKPERTVTVDEWECGESLLASVPAESEAR